MSDVPPIPPMQNLPVLGPKFLAAFLKAQRAFKPATKDAVNPHFKSSYSTMESVVEALAPLHDNGIMWLQPPSTKKGEVSVTTILVHESGEGAWATVSASMPDNATPQQIGSALTYLCRYGLKSISGLPSGDDDDGHAASQRSKPQPPPPPKAPAGKPESTPWQQALLLGVQRNLDQKTLAALVKKLSNRSKPSEVTAGDVETLAAYLAPGPNGAPSKFEADEIRAKEKATT